MPAIRTLFTSPARIAVPVAAAILAATALAASASGAGTAGTLRGASFAASYPSGWTVKPIHPVAGTTTYLLGATGVTVSALGLPTPGGVAISISEAPIRLYEAVDPVAVPSDPLKLVPVAISTPRTATKLHTVVAVHAMTLDGAAGGAVTFSYDYKGVPDVQSDVVARHGREILSIEVDGEPAQSAVAAAEFKALLAGWRWTGDGPAVNPSTLRYPPTVERDSERGCKRTGRVALCTCVLRYLEAHVPLATYVSYAIAVQKGRTPPTPQWVLDASLACARSGTSPPAAPTVASQDIAGKELAQTAQLAMETLATDNAGSYASATPAALARIQPTIQLTAGGGHAFLSAASGAATSYALTATSASGDTYTITRSPSGALTHTCANAATSTACVHGSW
jgi:hypothetical protein